jgi:hypothetical protein
VIFVTEQNCLHCELMATIARHMGDRPFELSRVADSLCDVIADFAGRHPDVARADVLVAAIGPLTALKVAAFRARNAQRQAAGAPAGATLQ